MNKWIELKDVIRARTAAQENDINEMLELLRQFGAVVEHYRCSTWGQTGAGCHSTEWVEKDYPCLSDFRVYGEPSEAGPARLRAYIFDVADYGGILDRNLPGGRKITFGIPGNTSPQTLTDGQNLQYQRYILKNS